MSILSSVARCAYDMLAPPPLAINPNQNHFMMVLGINTAVEEMTLSDDTDCDLSDEEITAAANNNNSKRLPSPPKKLKSNLSSESTTSTSTHTTTTSVNTTMAATTTEAMPELEDVESYLQLLHQKSGVAEEVLIVTLIFLKRLMTCAGTKLTVRNWRSLLATSLLLASKTFDDLAMSNKSFSCFLPFTLHEINRWERLFLAGIKYDCNVSNEEFAAQYMDLLSVSRNSNRKNSPANSRVLQLRRYSSESIRS
jgi:hypothetical protein